MYDPNIHHRRSIRLKTHDYTQADTYFVTICTEDRLCRFGAVEDGLAHLNETGQMVESVLRSLEDRYRSLEVDVYVIMPNHLHAIMTLRAETSPAPTTVAESGHVPRTRAETSPAPTLGDIVCAFKSISTREYIVGVRQFGWPAFERRLWQRDYFERIVRDEREMDACREYILLNPARWSEDKENPENIMS